MEEQRKVAMARISKARRELILAYADAAACLYGALSLAEFAEVFNHYEDDKTDERETGAVLRQHLKVKPDEAEFSLDQDLIVGPTLFPEDFQEDKESLRNLRDEQKGKPRYLPESGAAFRMFSNPVHIEPRQPYDELKAYILKNNLQGKKEFDDIDDDLLGLLEMIQDGATPAELIQTFINRGYHLDDLDVVNAFIQQVMTVYNNTRLFENNGFTPHELTRIQEAAQPKGPILHQPEKVGRNDPCPCGSGKKYKRCCALLEESGAAQLSQSECKLFYETWYKLLDYTNRKLKVVAYKFSLKHPDIHNEVLLLKIRERLWKQPELIGEFIAEGISAGTLSDEETDLLQAWEHYHIQGKYFLVKYLPEAAVLMSMDRDKEVRLYAVKGVTNSIAGALRRKLPMMLETVLLPFKDRIVYDSFMTSHAIEFSDNVTSIVEAEYARVEKECGIIRMLGE